MIFSFILLFSVSFGQQVDFTEFDLENGLHVILHQDNTAPVVITSVMYDVGGKDREEGRTGFAHFFEHLLFITFVLLNHGTHVTFGILNEKIYSIYNWFSNIFKR